MKIEAKVTGQEGTKRLLKNFERLTGKGIETGIKEMALSSARALATKMQPYGVTDRGRSKKFQDNIEKQIAQIFIGVNLGVYPETGSLESAHRAARRRGRVRGEKITKEGGKRWKGVIDQSQLRQLAVEKQSRAGRAKAGWIAAGNSLGVAKMSKIGAWINRHVGKGYGTSHVMGRGLKTQIQLQNRTPYLSYLQKEREVRAALKEGREKGITRLRIIVDKQTKKLAQTS
jgi:hypothetical protein